MLQCLLRNPITNTKMCDTLSKLVNMLVSASILSPQLQTNHIVMITVLITCLISIIFTSELMAMFVEEPRIKQHFKNRLVGVVLNGYLSLKRLVVQRTKLIDLTQEELLDLLEDMTTGKCQTLTLKKDITTATFEQ